jgi:hypothetical protein
MAEGVHTAVNVGVMKRLEITECSYHGSGLLAGGGVVQIDQWTAPDLGGENGKVPP